MVLAFGIARDEPEGPSPERDPSAAASPSADAGRSDESERRGTSVNARSQNRVQFSGGTSFCCYDLFWDETRSLRASDSGHGAPCLLRLPHRGAGGSASPQVALHRLGVDQLPAPFRLREHVLLV